MLAREWIDFPKLFTIHASRINIATEEDCDMYARWRHKSIKPTFMEKILPSPHRSSSSFWVRETCFSRNQTKANTFMAELRERERNYCSWIPAYCPSPSLCLCPAMSWVPVLHVMMIVIDRTIEAGTCSDKHRLAQVVKLWTFGNWER